MNLKKIKITSAAIMCVLLCCGCTSNDELIDINDWKDKLVSSSGSYLNMDAIGETAGNAADAVGDAVGAGYDKAKELGKGAANLINDWITQSSNAPDPLAPLTQDTPQDEPEVAGGRIKVPLLYTVDGDTIAVEYSSEEVRVRLIGINTPESVAPDDYLEETGKENTEEGKVASDFLKEYLADTTYVYLEFDETLNDEYGRLLAYVWVSGTGKDVETQMLNGIMLTKGYAELMIIPPNTKYEEELKAIIE